MRHGPLSQSHTCCYAGMPPSRDSARWQHDTDTTRFDEIWSNACACHVHVRAVKVELEHHCLLATRSPTHVTSSPQHRSGRTAASLDARAVFPPPWAMRISRRPPTALGLGAAITDLPLGGSSHLSRRWSLMARVALRSVRGTTSVHRVSHLCPGLPFHRPDTHLVRLALRALRDAHIAARGRAIRFVTERARH